MEGYSDPSAHMKGGRRGGEERRGGGLGGTPPCYLPNMPRVLAARWGLAPINRGHGPSRSARAWSWVCGGSHASRLASRVVHGAARDRGSLWREREWREEARGNVCIFALAPAPGRAAWCEGAVQAARRLCWSCGSRRGFTIKVLSPPRRRLQDPMREEIGSGHLRPEMPIPRSSTCPQGAPLSDRRRPD